MIRKLGIAEILKALQEKVETNTSLPCYDAVPEDAPAPFFYMETTQVQPQDTKTMYVTEYDINLHCIAPENKSSVPVLELFRILEEALTEDITIPEEYNLIGQYSDGLQTLTTDETGEKHAIMAVRFLVSYGYKTK